MSRMTLRWMVIVVTLLSVVSLPAIGTAQGFDGFDDPTVWSPLIVGSGPTIDITFDQLTITLPANSADDPVLKFFGAGLSSVCQVSGDFDLQVDYELLVWPATSGVRVGLVTAGVPERVGCGAADNCSGEVYLLQALDGLHGITPTSDLAGTLRLVRTGGTVTGYYLGPAGDWIVIGSGPGATGNVRVELRAWSHNYYAFAHQDVQVAFTTFLVNQGGIICP